MSEPLKKGDLITVVQIERSKDEHGLISRLVFSVTGVVEDPDAPRRVGKPEFTWFFFPDAGDRVPRKALYDTEGKSWIRGHGLEAEQALKASRRLLR